MFDDRWCSLQEERRVKDELKAMLAAAVAAEKGIDKKFTEVRAELAATESRLAKAEAAVQVSNSPAFHVLDPMCEFVHVRGIRLGFFSAGLQAWRIPQQHAARCQA